MATDRFRSLLVSWKRFVRDESGQGVLEYALILAFTVMFVQLFFSKFLDSFRERLAEFGDVMEEDLAVGVCRSNQNGDECFVGYGQFQ